VKDLNIKQLFQNRFYFFIFAIWILLILLTMRLADLTISQGEVYREISDSRRLQQVEIPASRGMIFDSSGQLLAGNQPSFVVQLSKDEIKKAERNETLWRLGTILDQNAERVVNELPITMNGLVREVDGDILPVDLFAYLREQPELIQSVLSQVVTEAPYRGQFSAKRALWILSRDDESWMRLWDEESQGVKNENDTARLAQALLEQENDLREWMAHPVVRKNIFEIYGKEDPNLQLVAYQYTFEEDRLDKKRSLSQHFSGITAETEAAEDFYQIAYQLVAEEMALSVTSDGMNLGRAVIDLLGLPITVSISERGTVAYQEDVAMWAEEARTRLALPETASLMQVVVEEAHAQGKLKEVILSDSFKYQAQKLILSHGLNPGISVSKWKYTAILLLDNWKQANKVPVETQAKEALGVLADRYGLDPLWTDREKMLTLNLIALMNKQGYRAYESIDVAYQLNATSIVKLMENEYRMPGVQVNFKSVRTYQNGSTAAHTLGYLGKISQQNEIEKYIDSLGYSPNEFIGKTGIENRFESVLRGTPGSQDVEVDVRGKTLNVVKEENPVQGGNVYLSIDLHVQQMAEEALAKSLDAMQVAGVYESPWGNYNYKEAKPNAKSAAMVAIDVKTGKIIAIANVPDYDPNLFAVGISQSDWDALLPENEKDLIAPRPLLNIASQSMIQPGSTFKMVTALAALENGVNPKQKINTKGFVEIGTQAYGCWIWNRYHYSHGPEDMRDAIADSCNYYFYSLVLGENQQTGERLSARTSAEDILAMATKLGLNDKTGIEISIPSEKSAGVPSEAKKQSAMKSSLRRWLNKHLSEFVPEETNPDADQMEDWVEEISSWVEIEPILSGSEVRRRLLEMGLLPDLPMEDGQSLKDVIKYSYLNFASWKMGDELIMSIGQGDNAYTSLQMANYVATLANGGKRYELTLMDRVVDQEGNETVYGSKPYEQLEFESPGALQVIKEAMLQTTEEGTARSIFADFPIQVGAKTGSAEKDGLNPVTGEPYDEFGWFVAFAPYDEPEIAVAVIGFQTGSGGAMGAAVRDVIAEYLGLNSEKSPIAAKPRLME
jgi:penicillin-binding protein 2